MTVALSSVDYLTVEHATLPTFEKRKITVNWDFSKIPKESLQVTPIWAQSFSRVARFPSLSQKNGFVFADQIWHYEALNQYSTTGRFHFGFYSLQNKFIDNLNIGRKFSKSSKVCLAFSEKWFCIRRSNLAL